jgi:hypothetical protein
VIAHKDTIPLFKTQSVELSERPMLGSCVSAAKKSMFWKKLTQAVLVFTLTLSALCAIMFAPEISVNVEEQADNHQSPNRTVASGNT